MMWPLGFPPIRGAERDPNAAPEEIPGSPIAAVPEVMPEADAAEPQTVEVDGDVVPVDVVKQWQDAYENRESWERSHKQKDQRYAEVRSALEDAFGKPFPEWGDAERLSLNTFKTIERRMRTDPAYASTVQEAFTRIYRDQGATPKQAAAQARGDVKQIQEGTAASPPVHLPTHLLQVLSQTSQDVQAVKQAVVAQELGRLEGHVENALDAAVDAHTGPVQEYRDLIEDSVLSRLDQEFEGNDAEMLKAAYDGTLAGRIDDLVKTEARRIETALSRRSASRPVKAPPAVAPPFRGTAASGATGAADMPTTLEEMHRRMKAALTAP